jgi:hypothetical protein
MATNKDPESVIFEAIDPDNRICKYTQKAKSHIFKNRKESISKLGNSGIKLTIEDPDYITEDKDFETTKNYYRPHKREHLDSYGSCVKVSIDYGQGEQYGFVKTVFILDKDKIYPNPKDKLIWKR